MQEKDLIERLAGALRPFSSLPTGSGYEADRYLIAHETIHNAQEAIVTWAAWKQSDKAQAQGPDSPPWPPASACDVAACDGASDGVWDTACQRAEMPGYDPEAERRFQETQARKRTEARRRAKRLLVSYLKQAWDGAGLTWDYINTEMVEKIVDAILTAAGA